MALELDADHPAAVRQPREDIAEAGRERDDAAVEGDERRALGVAVLLVPDGHTVDQFLGHGTTTSAAGRTHRNKGGQAARRLVDGVVEPALEQLLAADLSGLDLVAFMVDGVHFAEHTCVVALGIAIDGTKHPLSLVEGSTENATLVTELIVGLRERGLDVTRPILAVLDGSKALRRAVLDVFDRPVIARCQLHKICECCCGAPGWRTTRLGAGDSA